MFRYRLYENDILSLEPLGESEQKAKSSSGQQLEKPIIDATVDNLLNKGNAQIKELFEELRSRILELDENIKERATSLYIAYRVTKNFAEVHIGKNQLKLFLRPIDYKDPDGRVDKIPEGYQWTLDRRVYLKSKDDLDYVLSLIEQSYKDVL